MRASTLCLLTTLIAAAGPVAAAAAASVADCHAASGESVLVSTSIPAIDARAVWLDARAVLWPQKSASSRFAIHHASNGGILTESGASATGADLRLPLKAAPKAQAGPPHYLGAGATLVLSEAGRTRLPTLLRGEVVLVEEDAAGQVLDATRIQPAGALDALFAAAAEPLDFGAKVHRDRPGGPQTDFRVWAPTAQGVALCLYPDATGAADTVLPLTRDPASGAWHTGVPGDLSARAAAYTYLVDVFVPGRGLVRNRVTDPYALSLTTDSARSVVIDLDAPDLAPAGWAQDARPTRVRAPTDLVIYELHVRDFSASDLTVPAEHRGKYLAFTDTGSDGMQHLARLAQAGVTDVHLLPIFDLATVPETGCVTPRPEGAPDGETQQATVEAVKAVDCFNWGYDPWHFTAPEGSYATDPADGRVRILELRRMVQALHRLGLRVGMDVVYNHTTASGQHPRSVLDRIVPGYYHRLDARGQVERSTCCDNTATEHRMMAKLMIDSTVVWARDHRIDSFRFDLMGHQPRDAMLRLQRAVDAAAGRHIHLIGEGWNFGEVADGRRFVQASQLSLNGSGIATFSDRARDAVRGGGAGDNGLDQIARQGWINGLFLDPNPESQGRATRDDLLRATDLVRVGLAGSLRGYALQTP